MKAGCIFIISFLLLACSSDKSSDEITGIRVIPECKRQPSFVRRLGFDANRSALSTSERRTKGLVLKEFNFDNTVSRTYQAPGWNIAGGMGPIVLDDKGNVFVSPAPVINTLDNDPIKQNIIYKVDAGSGDMKPFFDLPRSQNPSPENPYGIMGMTLDCETGLLYVTSVSGSTRSQQAGKIFCIQPGTEPAVVDVLENTDAFGVDIAYLNEEKRLFFGSARNGTVYSIPLTEKGKFSGKIQKEFSITGLGPRGDDVVRKMQFEKNGALTVSGIEFHFNLIAPTEKQETLYAFIYNTTTRRWDYRMNSPVLTTHK